ncbi:MAG: IS200/IS605 family element transposase accessory protein TnpB [Okeania sp. SIO3C4]|nr:IS200/IS605 family element transposase accessory protein TnpB [Okeania sp. SIO3B3]NER03305.1 IS200/IS605 family element transposase accessory protein TnpB [Okeania sp. SIO3C4]
MKNFSCFSLKGEDFYLNYSVNYEIGQLIIGQSQNWKQGIKLGKKNNRQFVNIPHYKLIEMLRYKAQLRGIKEIITEESYTSQSSFLDGDDLPKYGDKKPKFSGKRVTRGLYKTRENKLLNADVKGSFNIIKKVIP